MPSHGDVAIRRDVLINICRLSLVAEIKQTKNITVETLRRKAEDMIASAKSLLLNTQGYAAAPAYASNRLVA